MKFSTAILLLTSAVAAAAAPTAEPAPAVATITSLADLGNGPDVATVTDPAVIDAYIAQLEAVIANRPVNAIEYDVETPSLISRATIQTNTDYYLFTVSLNAFISARNSKADPRLNWTADGCSNSPDKPAGFNFLPRCYRHDFGYRNYKAQSRFTSANRLKIDNKFKSDLYALCATYTGVDAWKGVACRRIADIYWAAVRTLGGL